MTLTGSAEFQSLSYEDNKSEKVSNDDQVKRVERFQGKYKHIKDN